MSNYPDGAILDEAQRTPELFSYLQQILDEQEKNGLFILTGSNNFLLQDNISQSLAGRVGYLKLTIHPFRGNLFENLVIVDFLKRLYNKGKSNNLFFWRDNTGNEIDLLIKMENKRVPVEIKSGQTISDEFFKGIRYWNKLSQTKGGFLIYGGNTVQKRSDAVTAVPLNKMSTIEI